ncbi:MAG TPA: DUF2783 domain-containing protein [Ferrovibrio sp.]|jgi:predicted LPLAT superfamily acyltransferase|uniref:DUF2783 domain-containing protein n=1 Tax=Ferrovibrio sp. TaxID=1917215 RepID=UPI002B4AC16D|nr:DUF2783 domain-containing protein [Ferrovibrio sp.]HLT78364.1 DUF2783 domain-containing protein [Ferrovibrio sp.]
MAKLNTAPNLPDPDGFYEALVKMTSGLDDAAAQVAMSKLVLLLANHIGDEEVLREAMTIARGEAEN